MFLADALQDSTSRYESSLFPIINDFPAQGNKFFRKKH